MKVPNVLFDHVYHNVLYNYMIVGQFLFCNLHRLFSNRPLFIEQNALNSQALSGMHLCIRIENSGNDGFDVKAKFKKGV